MSILNNLVSAISRFRRVVITISALSWCYAAQIGS